PKASEHDTPVLPNASLVELEPVYLAPGQSTQVLINLTTAGNLATVEVEGPAAPELDEPVTETEVAEVAVVEVGFIDGQVLSSEGKAVIQAARIYARGVDAEAITDADGRFRLQ